MGTTGDAVPPERLRSSLRFAGFILDIDACSVTRDSGEVIALTRSEFGLLRFLAERPGRVASREALLGAIAKRPFAPFDRSIDVVIGRLRRKVEADSAHPRLIVTVPGEGYRFDGVVKRATEASLVCKPDGDVTQDGQASPPSDDPPRNRLQPGSRPRLPYLVGALCLALLVALIGSWPRPQAKGSVRGTLPSVVVLPFSNFTGDANEGPLARGLAFELTAFLASSPDLQVMAAPGSLSDAAADAEESLNSTPADYVVRGGVRRLHDALRVTVMLHHRATQTTVWSKTFDSNDSDSFVRKQDIPRQIYDSLAGFQGAIRASEERMAWRKSSVELGEYDYYLQGFSPHLQFDPTELHRARAIIQEGLDRDRDSTLLRIALAWTHLWAAMSPANPNPLPDIERAGRLADEALSAKRVSPLEAWLAHWLMAFVYQWRDGDFPRSVVEARKAVSMVPNDSYARNDLSWVLANAGYGDEAIAWARSGLEHESNAPSRHHANLAWAYHVTGRDQEAVDALGEKSAEFPVLYAALLVRLGEVERAKAVIADYLRTGGGDTIEREDNVPLVEPAGTEFLEVLRKAGLPER